MDEKKYIRFIDSMYNTLFYVPDGGSIKVHSAWDSKEQVFPCKYIDEHHFEASGSCLHICQFAEFMERNGNTYEPVSEIGDLGFYKKKYLDRNNLGEDGKPIPYYNLISFKDFTDPARTETNYCFCLQPASPDKAFCKFVFPTRKPSDLRMEFAGAIEELCGDQKVCSRVNNIVKAIKENMLMEQLESVRDLVEALDTEANEKAPGFEHNGVWITNPFYEESLRFEVDPFSYYGAENVMNFVEQVKNLGGNEKPDVSSLDSKIMAADALRCNNKSGDIKDVQQWDLERD